MLKEAFLFYENGDLRKFAQDTGAGGGLPQGEKHQEHSLLTQHMVGELQRLGFNQPELVEATASFFDLISTFAGVSAVGVGSRKPFAFDPPVLDITISTLSADKEQGDIESMYRLYESFRRKFVGFFDTTFDCDDIEKYPTPEEFQLLLKQDAEHAREGKLLMHARKGGSGWELYKPPEAKSEDLPVTPLTVSKVPGGRDSLGTPRTTFDQERTSAPDQQESIFESKRQPSSPEKVVDSKVGSFTDGMIVLLNLPDDEFNVAMDLMPEFGWYASPLRDRLIKTLEGLRKVYRDNKDPNRPKIFGDIQDSRGFTRPTLSERRRRIGNAPLSDPQDIDPL